MIQRVVSFFAAAAVVVAVTVLLSGSALAAPAASSPVWPAPADMTKGTDVVTLGADLKFECNGAACPAELQPAFARYLGLVFFAGAPGSATGTVLTTVTVSVAQDQPLSLDSDESYTLDVTGATASITATSQWGALRALESFSQLVEWSVVDGANVYTINVSPVHISDAPRFAWRGVLVDSARHYLSVNAIKKVLDAMSYNKYNVLHWHVVDDEAFPLVSATYPNFSRYGAYDPEYAVYTRENVQDIVGYARARGIRVMLELDMPAHLTSWSKGYPDLVIKCDGGVPLADPTGPFYEVLSGLLDEFIPLVPDMFVHLGGDEAYTYKCWETSPKVQSFMQDKGMQNMTELRSYFEMTVQQVVASKGLRTVFWEEVFTANSALLNTTVVNVWLGMTVVEQAVRQGLNTVCSYGWYLDQQQPAGGAHYFWVDTWMNFYMNDPLFQTTLTPEEQKLVLGGEASQWGEQVDSASIHTRMWPRAAATAERLWSPASLRDTNAAAPRLTRMYCWLRRRGIASSPIRPSAVYGYCRLPPGME